MSSIPRIASSELITSATLVQFNFPYGLPLLSPGFLPLEADVPIDGHIPPDGGVKFCLFGQLGFMCPGCPHP